MGNRLYFMSNGKAHEMKEEYFAKEADLQQIVTDNPNIVARSFDDTTPLNHYLVDQEYGIAVLEGSGGEYSLDHLLVDESGIPVLVEVKRSTDTRIKREVVAQMIDYACRASSWSISEMRDKFLKRNENPPESLTSDEFWQIVSDNLKQEHFRMVFVADRIPDSLKVMIEFMDRSMKDIEVYGVELCPYRSGEQLLLSGNFIGNPLPDEKKASSTRSKERRIWSEESFLAEVETVMGEDAAQLVTDLIAFSANLGLATTFGKGLKLATLAFKKEGMTVYGISQQTSGGEFVIEFYRLFLDKLHNQNASLDFVEKSINALYKEEANGKYTRKETSIMFPLRTLLSEGNLEGFEEIIMSLLA